MSFVDISTVGAIALGTAVKSAIIPLALTAIRTRIPNYADAQCLLRLVNETANEHFSNHVFYKNVKYDESCAGQPLDDYVNMQFNELGQFENKLLKGTLTGAGAIAVVLLLVHIAQKFNFRYTLKLLLNQFVVYNSMITVAFLCLCHFEQDITFMLGNIMHHSDISKYSGKSNASFVDSLPNGFCLNTLCNFFWTIWLLCVLTPKIKIWGNSEASRMTVVCQYLVGVAVALYQISQSHPLYHSMMDEEKFKGAMPFTFEYKAYKHVIVHHGNGDAFASHPILDPIFSVALSTYDTIHNKMLELEINSPQETAVAIAYDWVLSMIVVVVMLASLFLMGTGFDLVFGKAAAEKAEKVAGKTA